MIHSKPVPRFVFKILFTLLIFFSTLTAGVLIANYKGIDVLAEAEKIIESLKRDDGKKVTFASKQKLDAVTIGGIRYLKLVTVDKDTLYSPFDIEDNANSIAIINTIDSTMMGKTITWKHVTLRRLPSGITTISK
jgi:hypothetical protein